MDNLKKKNDEIVESRLNKLIKKITFDIEEFRFNNAIISIIEFSDYIKNKDYDKETLEKLILLISPFAPHLAEEMHEKLGNKGFCSLASWPKCDEKKINENLEKLEELINKTKDDIINIKNMLKLYKPEVYIYCIPKEFELFNKNLEFLRNSTDSLSIKVFSVNDKNKYDPKNKAVKAKLNRPAIYLE